MNTMTRDETAIALHKLIEGKKEMIKGTERMAEPEFNKIDHSSWKSILQSELEELSILKDALYWVNN